MIDRAQLDQVLTAEAYGSDGQKIGKVGQVYLDDSTGDPAWATVNTGFFGTNETFIPLDQASYTGDRLTVPFDKEMVKNAPNVASDQHISPEEEQELYRYYSVSYGTATTESTTSTTGTTTGTVETSTVGHDMSGPTTDEAMTRSEEQVHVGTQTREVGRARLRKYVTTETVTETVPVTREQPVIHREPITDDNVAAATSGSEFSEEEHEVILHEEVPVVEKEVHPVERVQLDTETVTEQRTVSADVRKEQIDTDGGTDSRTTAPPA